MQKKMSSTMPMFQVYEPQSTVFIVIIISHSEVSDFSITESNEDSALNITLVSV